jgi:hypothetical protein
MNDEELFKKNQKESLEKMRRDQEIRKDIQGRIERSEEKAVWNAYEKKKSEAQKFLSYSLLACVIIGVATIGPGETLAVLGFGLLLSLFALLFAILGRLSARKRPTDTTYKHEESGPHYIQRVLRDLVDDETMLIAIKIAQGSYPEDEVKKLRSKQMEAATFCGMGRNLVAKIDFSEGRDASVVLAELATIRKQWSGYPMKTQH